MHTLERDRHELIRIFWRGLWGVLCERDLGRELLVRHERGGLVRLTAAFSIGTRLAAREQLGKDRYGLFEILDLRFLV
jgi:hypothetical protein